MISVYELPGYNNQVEQAIGKCHPAFKKKKEKLNHSNSIQELKECFKG